MATDVEAAKAWLADATAKLAASPATLEAPVKSTEISAKVIEAS